MERPFSQAIVATLGIALTCADLILIFWGLDKLEKLDRTFGWLLAVLFLGFIFGSAYWIDRRGATMSAMNTTDARKLSLGILLAVFGVQMALLLAYLTWFAHTPYADAKDLLWSGFLLVALMAVSAVIEIPLHALMNVRRKKQRIKLKQRS